VPAKVRRKEGLYGTARFQRVKTTRFLNNARRIARGAKAPRLKPTRVETKLPAPAPPEEDDKDEEHGDFDLDYNEEEEDEWEPVE
jgi:hypothetical protein